MSYPIPSAPPYVPPHNPVHSERKQPSALGETIFCIALSALSYFVSNVTKHHDRGVSNFCRILPVGILGIWILRRISNSTNSSSHHHHSYSNDHRYQDRITTPIIVTPSSASSFYSEPQPRHNDPISGYQTNPNNSNFSYSGQHFVPENRNTGRSDSIPFHQTNSYNSSSSTNEHLAPQHRNTGPNDQIRY